MMKDIYVSIIWRIGIRNGNWNEFGSKIKDLVKVPSNRIKREWKTFPSEVISDTPFNITWKQDKIKESMIYIRLLKVPCGSLLFIELYLNEERIYSHEYKPAVVWLHKYFDAIVNCYLPKRFQRIGENILTPILKRGEAKIDFIELREILPGGNMWLFGNLRSVVNFLRT